MQQAQQPQVGDYVRACCSLVNLPEGSIGIVQRVFHTVDLYDVLFDKQRIQYMLHGRDIVLASPERAREAGR